MKEHKLDVDSTRSKFNEWIEKNRNQLPLNFETWEIDIVSKKQNQHLPANMALGKYNSIKTNFSPFYKAISRIVELPFKYEK